MKWLEGGKKRGREEWKERGREGEREKREIPQTVNVVTIRHSVNV